MPESSPQQTARTVDLSAREIALATSGLATVEDTRRQDSLLQPLLAQPYPEPDDAAAWAERRAAGPMVSGAVSLPAGVRVSDAEIAGVPCRVLEPETVAGGYLHLHGGGWSLGSHRNSDARLAELAAATGLRVVSVGYRLAPEHPISDAIADGRAVAAALTAGPAGFWAIGGESAGAHLAVTTLLGLRDAGRRPFAAAVLTYGCYDLAGTPARRRAPHAEEVATLARIVLGTTEEAVLRDPAVSPLYADLAGMPPARFLCGTRDDLLEDTVMMEARWRLVAPTELDLVAGAAHAFTVMPGSTSAGARAAEAAYLRGALAAWSSAGSEAPVA